MKIQNGLHGFMRTGEKRLAKKGEFWTETVFGTRSVHKATKDFQYVETEIVRPISQPREASPSVFTRETIVVSFGSDEYELTTDEANALIRSLELAVA